MRVIIILRNGSKDPPGGLGDKMPDYGLNDPVALPVSYGMPGMAQGLSHPLLKKSI